MYHVSYKSPTADTLTHDVGSILTSQGVYAAAVLDGFESGWDDSFFDPFFEATFLIFTCVLL